MPLRCPFQACSDVSQWQRELRLQKLQGQACAAWLVRFEEFQVSWMWLLKCPTLQDLRLWVAGTVSEASDRLVSVTKCYHHPSLHPRFLSSFEGLSIRAIQRS